MYIVLLLCWYKALYTGQQIQTGADVLFLFADNSTIDTRVICSCTYTYVVPSLF